MMLGRVVHSADFQRLLATPTRSRSAHFALHYAPWAPGGAALPEVTPLSQKLSTDPEDVPAANVDNHSPRVWLGSVLPKRHARRAVTRNLLRRQIRGALVRHAGQLPGGCFVVRLRAPFPRQDFPSAASRALSQAARDELDALLTGTARRRP